MTRSRRDRLRILTEVLASPRDTWLLTRMAGWAVLLPALKRLLPLPRLVRLAASPGGGSSRDPGRETRIVVLADLLYRARARAADDNCLERSLVTYRYLARANARPELVVGMGRRDESLLGHVWVTLDGAPVHDSPERLADFVPALSFSADGSSATPPRAGSAAS